MTKPIVAFRNFANAPKKHTNVLHGLNLQILSVKARSTQKQTLGSKGFYRPRPIRRSSVYFVLCTSMLFLVFAHEFGMVIFEQNFRRCVAAQTLCSGCSLIVTVDQPSMYCLRKQRAADHCMKLHVSDVLWSCWVMYLLFCNNIRW